MPNITVEGPPLEIDKKRVLVKKLTQAAVDVYNIEHIIVLIKENPPENVGLSGELLADRRKKSS
jgi:4-oxalocrotonate tautomerase